MDLAGRPHSEPTDRVIPGPGQESVWDSLSAWPLGRYFSDYPRTRRPLRIANARAPADTVTSRTGIAPGPVGPDGGTAVAVSG